MVSKASSNATNQAVIARIRQFDWRGSIVYLGFIALFLFFSITLRDAGFLTPNNLLNIVRQTAIISVMAVAVTYVIASGEIDLSVGAVAGLASVTAAMAVSQYGLLAGIVVGLLTGVIVGGANGLLVTIVGVPSFLVTLGMMGIARGTAQWITATAPVPILNDTFNNIFGSGQASLLIWMVIVLAVGHLALRKTAYGRQVLATGGNESAARFSGVNTRRIKLLVLVVSASVAALAGMLYAGRLHSGRFQWGDGDELSVIAAVILGGTSLFGGSGTVIGSVIGALMIGLINNGLILMGLETSQQVIIRGVIIILAVALARRKPGS